MIVGHYASPLGDITIGVERDCLCALCFCNQKNYSRLIPETAVEGPHPVTDLTIRWLDIYFSGRCPDFMPPLATAASAAKERIRQALLDIPFGSTVSYSQIAAKAGMPAAHRAAASLIAANPISIIVPCHRVIAKNGALGGYAAGPESKRVLLALESIQNANI